MPFDEKLAERIRQLLKVENRGFKLSEKKMFGGLAFMLDDKMCCGVLEDRLVARVGPEQYERMLKKPHVCPMDFTGRPLKGFVYIDAKGVRRDEQLQSWLSLSSSFVSTLEIKKGSKRKRTISQLSPSESARDQPLSRLVNFGPVTLREFKAMGITTFGQLEDLGWESVCRQWVENFPERLNVNAFVGVIATLEGISWTQVSTSDRAKAKSLANLLKREYGIATPSRKIQRGRSRS